MRTKDVMIHKVISYESSAVFTGMKKSGLICFFFLLTLLSSAGNTICGNVLYTSLPAYVIQSWWQPAPGVSWQWQLSGIVDTSIDVEMYDIDLFETPKETIEELHRQGRVVICYFSAGSWEEYRVDAGSYPDAVLGKPLDGWPDERWLDIRKMEILDPILQRRLDLAVEKGCDGVEPDNIDGYNNISGFPLASSDQLRFNKWLAAEAHRCGLSIGLKNDLGQVRDLVEHFDWALNEQCFFYGECDLLVPFIKADKAVFGVEYDLERDHFCDRANAMNLDWLQKRLELDSWRLACR